MTLTPIMSSAQKVYAYSKIEKSLYDLSLNHKTYEKNGELFIEVNWDEISDVDECKISIYDKTKRRGRTYEVSGNGYKFEATYGTQYTIDLEVKFNNGDFLNSDSYNIKDTQRNSNTRNSDEPLRNTNDNNDEPLKTGTGSASLNNQNTNEFENVNRVDLESPTIMMPDAESAVFYCKDNQSINVHWNEIEGAQKYLIEISDLTRDNGRVAISEYVNKDAINYRFNILGAHAYKIAISAIDKYDQKSRSEYIIEEGRIVTRNLSLECADGRDVQTLHEKLNYLGLNTGLQFGKYDGHFRSETDTAVKAVQSFMGQARINGVVENDTWWSINTLVKEINVLSSKEKQTLISKLNVYYKREQKKKEQEEKLKSISKGDFLTETEVKDGLVVIGINFELVRTLSYGMSGNDVSELQNILKLLNHQIDDKKGFYGNSTKEAIKKFQKSSKLEVDGVFGKNTCRALNSNRIYEDRGYITNTSSKDFDANYNREQLKKYGIDNKKIDKIVDKIQDEIFKTIELDIDDMTEEELTSLRNGIIVGIDDNTLGIIQAIKGQYPAWAEDYYFLYAKTFTDSVFIAGYATAVVGTGISAADAFKNSGIAAAFGVSTSGTLIGGVSGGAIAVEELIRGGVLTGVSFSCANLSNRSKMMLEEDGRKLRNIRKTSITINPNKPIEITIDGRKVKLRVDVEPDSKKIQIQDGHGKDSYIDRRIDPKLPIEPQIPKLIERNLSKGQLEELIKRIEKAKTYLY